MICLFYAAAMLMICCFVFSLTIILLLKFILIVIFAPFPFPIIFICNNSFQYDTFKLIYRRYAGLYFCFGVDVTDNELILMETIHLFVRILDQYFSNVCELDIVFQFNKVYAILDEYILAGEVQETSEHTILERMADQAKLE